MLGDGLFEDFFSFTKPAILGKLGSAGKMAGRMPNSAGDKDDTVSHATRFLNTAPTGGFELVGLIQNLDKRLQATLRAG